MAKSKVCVTTMATVAEYEKSKKEGKSIFDAKNSGSILFGAVNEASLELRLETCKEKEFKRATNGKIERASKVKETAKTDSGESSR
ncbi:MAG: hypothetical protein LBL91_03605 [Lachnospiraceae bacterium]|jgi:hypothetical protein|nr:hypothetical protein [Lachnospiraceae bacterium]